MSSDNPKGVRAAEQQRAWYSKNRERARAIARDSYQRNKGKHRERTRKVREANPEKYRALARTQAKRAYRRNPAKFKERQRRDLYGITQEQWDALFAAQGFACAICRTIDPGTKAGWQTDHCHGSGRLRGILCFGCNNGLGRFGDDPDRLRLAADYLVAHRGR